MLVSNHQSTGALSPVTGREEIAHVSPTKLIAGAGCYAAAALFYLAVFVTACVTGSFKDVKMPREISTIVMAVIAVLALLVILIHCATCAAVRFQLARSRD